MPCSLKVTTIHFVPSRAQKTLNDVGRSSTSEGPVPPIRDVEDPNSRHNAKNSSLLTIRGVNRGAVKWDRQKLSHFTIRRPGNHNADLFLLSRIDKYLKMAVRKATI